MKDRIAKQSLFNIQNLLDHQEFKRGKLLKLKIGEKKTPTHVEKVYSLISNSVQNKISHHQALCESIECLFSASRIKHIKRHPRDHEFYEKFSSPNQHRKRENFHFNFKKSATDMLDYINKMYPSNKKLGLFSSTPAYVYKIIKNLKECLEHSKNNTVSFSNLKEIFLIIHEEKKFTLFKSKKEMDLLNNIYNNVSFDEVQKRASKESDDNLFQAAQEAKNAVKSYKLNKKESRKLIEVDHENESKYRR